MSVNAPGPGCGYPVSPGVGFPRNNFAVLFLIILLLLCFPLFFGGGFGC